MYNPTDGAFRYIIHSGEAVSRDIVGILRVSGAHGRIGGVNALLPEDRVQYLQVLEVMPESVIGTFRRISNDNLYIGTKAMMSCHSAKAAERRSL